MALSLKELSKKYGISDNINSISKPIDKVQVNIIKKKKYVTIPLIIILILTILFLLYWFILKDKYRINKKEDISKKI